jgi:hypothetical protein
VATWPRGDLLGEDGGRRVRLNDPKMVVGRCDGRESGDVMVI